MAHQKYIEYNGESLKKNMIEHTIKLISKYGFEHVTMSQVCLASKCTRAKAFSCFENLRSILEASLASSFSHFISNITAQFNKSWENKDAAMEIWHQMVVYNINFPDQANALAHYLHNAYLFRVDNLKSRLSKALDDAYNSLEMDLSLRTSQNLKFVISLYLYRAANQFVRNHIRNAGYSAELEQNYYAKFVAPELVQKLSLPLI